MRFFIKTLLLSAVSAFIVLNQSYSQEEMQKWHHQGNDSAFPTGINAAEFYASSTDRPARKIVVAILDSGVDITHPDLWPNIWINADEVAGNKIDDDRNGYVDDIHGWNFIGGPDGRSVVKESYEVTRVYAKEKQKWEGVDPGKLKGKRKKEYEEYLEIKAIVESKLEGARNHIAEVKEMENIVMSALYAAKKEIGADSLDVAKLEASTAEEVNTAAKIIRNVEEQGIPVESIDWLIDIAREQFKSQIAADEDIINYSYNPEYNSRLIVGDVYEDFGNRYYGNNDVGGSFSYHGTHVAGIIGAVRNNGIGADGVADHVSLMALRMVPDGDERDKDVANAIIYAVDNGAEVINMSFGKGFSPEKKLVDNAMKYAAKKDVLLVLGAGNESTNLDQDQKYPNDTYEGKSKPVLKNLLSVGALSPEGGEGAIAEFSNYGKKEVDVFAPGVFIYSTTPDSTYDYASGTSMAAPVVSGVAAVIRSRYPALTAAQVKNIIIKSARKLPGQVIQPGTYDIVSASDLSVSGGSIDLPAAMKLAAATKGKRKASQIPAAYVRPAAGKT